MVHINLLPVRQIKEKIKARKEIVAFIMALLLLLAALATVFFSQASTTHRLQADIARLKTDKLKYKKTLDLIKQLEKDKDTIETQISIIKQLKKTSSLTVHILDEVAKRTPSDRMWLTSLNQSGTNLSISGMALDNRTIAKFMEDLKASIYITNVNLANSSLEHYAGRNLKSFSLSCTISADAKEEKQPN